MQTNIREKQPFVISGWIALIILSFPLLIVGWNIFNLIVYNKEPALFAIFLIPILFFLTKGFIILEPNKAGVMIFFGKYAGTIRSDGFFWVNPFYQKNKISLRARNLNTPTLKVNDRAGNPIDVAAVIVWKVDDTARATFDVENYTDYVTMQSESAVRQVVSNRWYDGDKDGNHSLRSDLDSVALLLKNSIQKHCALAGLEIIEARISHLAYAPEIASLMLRRQQAVAVVAARQQIVAGAVGMVKLAIEALENEKVVTLDNIARTRMVTNLMTVLVGDSEAQPVVSVDGE